MDDNLKILFFGNLAEIVGTHELIFPHSKDTDSLVKDLCAEYGALADQMFSIAINRKVVSENSLISNRDEVALLPPFSGG